MPLTFRIDGLFARATSTTRSIPPGAPDRMGNSSNNEPQAIDGACWFAWQRDDNRSIYDCSHAPR
jgi:hypothetical protein